MPIFFDVDGKSVSKEKLKVFIFFFCFFKKLSIIFLLLSVDPELININSLGSKV